MKTTCWCGHTQAEHIENQCIIVWEGQTIFVPCLCNGNFDNTEAAWKAYCEMYVLAQEDYKNNHSFLNKIIKWIWK